MNSHVIKVVRSAGLLTAAALVFSMVQLPAAQADTAPPVPTDPRTPVSVSADPLPTVQIDGVAWTQRVIGNTVYVGGRFTTARPAGAAPGVSTTARANLLAYDITTGNLITTWNVATNGDVLTIVPSPDSSILYIGGSFTTVNGAIRNRIAAVTRATGALVTTFTPKPDATVRAIVATPSTVYFGGLLSSVGGTTRTRVAAVRASDGGLLSWAPNAQGGSVHSLAMSPTGDKLIIGGSFTTMNGSSNPGYGMAAVDPTTGASLDWAANNTIRDAGPNAAVTGLNSDGEFLYSSGFVFGAGGNLEGIAKIRWSDGTVQWVEDCHGDTYGSYPKGDVIYAVSHAHYCGNLPDGFPQTDPWTQHYGTAFTKATTGTLGTDPHGYFNWAGTPSPSLLKWLPLMLNGTFTGQGQAGWTVSGNDSYVTYGGEFPKAGGIAQQGLVRYAVKSIAPNKIGPELNLSKFNPTVTSFARGTAKISWRANWDRDNENLTYQVIRNGVITAPIYQTDQLSSEWNRPNMGFLDTGLVAGQTYRYRVFARDPLGNEVRSDTVSVVVSATGDISPAAQGVLNDGARNFWRLGEGSGTTVVDWAGFDDATAQAGVTRGAAGAILGDSNNASTFDGTVNGSVAPSAPLVAPNTFTAEAWFNTTSTTGGKILGFGNAVTGVSSNYDRHIYMSDSGQLTFGIYPGGVRTLSTAKSYNDGQWHQVTASLGAGGMSLFVDGRRVALRTDVTAGQAYSGVWRIGGDNVGGWPGQPTSNFFTGVIDDVAIYPTALTSAQVSKHFTDSGRTLAGAAAPADAYGKAVYGSEPDLYWRLSEATGPTAVDSSPNQANGSYDGGVTLGGASGVGVSTDTSTTFDGATGAVASNATVTNPTVYSEELWFNTATTVGGKLIGFGSSQFGASGGYDRHVYMFNDGRLRFGTYTGQLNVIDSAKSYNDSQWHHLVATQGADGMNLIVDNELVGTNTQTGAQDYTGYWRVGGDTTWGGNDSNYFAGKIDEVAVYPRVLSTTEITDHFVKGGGTVAPPANVNPVAAFTFAVSQLSVAFDGTSSSDSDGTVASYAWDFGDGGTSTLASPTHAYPAAGANQVSLTVTDNAGGTNVVTKTVTTVAPPANVNPVAVFTFAVSQLSVAFDGTSSSDSDGTVASYAWDFGDGGTSTLASPTRAYAAAGPHQVTLTVTDNAGGTNAVTNTVTTVAPAAGPLASDTFTRTVTNGWGTAVDGGAWMRYGTASLFTVGNGTGQLKVATPGLGLRVALDKVASTNTDVRVAVALDKVANGGGAFVSVGARTIGTSDYRAKLKVASTGATTLYLTKVVANAETTLTSVNLPVGLKYTVGSSFQVRVQAFGTTPTTVRAKVWKTGTAEPAAWTLSATDATASLQVPGGVGLVAYLTSTATNQPVVVSFDNFSAVPAN